MNCIPRILLLTTCLVGFAGCESAPEDAKPLEAPTAPPAAAIASKAKSTKSKGTKPANDDKHEGMHHTVAYQPPFPDRTELFIPPDRDTPLIASATQGEERVQLQGFVNVDEPRAILTIDGNLAPLAVGSERYGVKVVSIEPPKVVLERGSTRWTTSLAQ